jgi:16S rRNA (uracil1498-N3)-methyltransferase
MQLSYFPEILVGETTLPEYESKHLIKVLRKSEGDTFYIIDGIGGLYNVEIIIASPKKCEIKVLSKKEEYNKRQNYLHIAIAPTKNIDRLEWFLEKATEIGINEVTPILCNHSERKTIKQERLQKILISAMKQSQQAYLPKLNPITKSSDFIQQIKKSRNHQLYIAHCEESNKQTLKAQPQLDNALVLIGPEGDFSTKEIELAINNNFIPVSLGETRLRTETAGVVACHTIQLLNS